MKKLIFKGISVLSITLSSLAVAQVPLADFTISPNPVCSGSLNVVQVTDNSSNSPTSWSYTITGGGPNSTMNTAQNPALSFNMPGTYSITLVATNGSGPSLPVTHTLLVLASPNGIINPGSQTTCLGGNPITMSVLTGGPGGTSLTFSWSTGATTSSISVSPSVTTTYSCIITSTNGCLTERTATVAIGQPTISIVSNPVNICPGSASTITATGTTPGPFTYSWSTGATTRTISTTTTGIYTVTVTNGNGCTATQTYSIGTSTTLSLTASSTPSILCAGNTATLHVTGGSTYSWSAGAATQNSSVNPVANTVYTVTGQIGTCTGTTTIALNVNVTPTIIASSNSPTLCLGNFVILNASGATTYTWLPSTVSQSTSVSPSVNTTYTVRGNNPGCPNRFATISISVSPNPVMTVTSSSSMVCTGEVVALAASGAVNYTWTGTTGNTGIVLVTPTATTIYTVTGSNSSNCTAMVSVTQNVNACLGINKEQAENLSLFVFPNPSGGDVIIQSVSTINVSVISQSGQLINTFSLDEINGRSQNVSDLADGLYFITGQNKNGLVRQKIVILK